MSSLTDPERIKLEKHFEMATGYVCDGHFSNRTFRDFMLEHTGVDVYAAHYDDGGESKANRMRTFWRLESDAKVGKLLKALLTYWKAIKEDSSDGLSSVESLRHDECMAIAERLLGLGSISDADALTPNSDDEDYALLAESIKEQIEQGKPQLALDRLHTFMVKWVRNLCSKHSIAYEKDVALHALFKRYTEFLKSSGLLESQMAERIMHAVSSLLDAFNTVRNNQTLAHDNPILNKRESVLIFSTLSGVLRFVQGLEDELSRRSRAETDTTSDEPSAEEVEAAGDQWLQLQEDIARGK